MGQIIEKYWWVGVLIVLLSVGGWWLWPKDKQMVLSPSAPFLFVEKPFQKYSFESLRKRVFVDSQIEIGRNLFKHDAYTPMMFKYKVEGKIVSGQINVPKGEVPENGFPVVIMLRGYVDQEIYETGVGTKNAAGFLASNGYITLAPDFLGYGESDMPPENVFYERFLRPVQVLELIASVNNLDRADASRISIWGHSNGGQLALSVLEIGGFDYPTSLWAPVSKPFPYSILYFTDEFDDYGKALRKVLAGLEAQYEVKDYDITNYFDWLEAPIQIHQGTIDDAVPLEWSLELNEQLKLLGKEVEMYIYEGADHNLVGPTSQKASLGASSWDLAMRRTLEWFR